MSRVSLLGYGRFGAALAGLLRARGTEVRALDPRAAVPDALRAASLKELVSGAEIVVVAVPVPLMAAAFAALRPLLTRAQLVMDVGSVKLEPARLMAETFGRDVPWAATHPLFGPTSLERDERPLRVVICPNPLHPAAIRRVTALFEGLGCEVALLDPDTHDRVMAYTHALAFFIAKGMIDVGAPLDATVVPPSFRGVARAMESVRADTGHLFGALHHGNPYAREARRRLLHALDAIERELTEGDERQGDKETPSQAAKAGPRSTSDGAAEADPRTGSVDAEQQELRDVRDRIDALDQELVRLLAQRAELSRRAAQAKLTIGKGVRDPTREKYVVAARRRWAAELGLDPESVDEIFQSILRFSRGVQGAPPSNKRKR